MTCKRFVRRSWGWYLTLLDRKHFKVKLLRFHKEKQCSPQYHNLRNELWLFLMGNGIFKGDPLHHKQSPWAGYSVESGEYRLVPIKEFHYYRAKTSSLVLEIQYGEKCEESDIVRI